MTLTRDGRFSLALPESGAAGSRVPHAETHMQIVLPGDRLALLSGRVSELGDPALAAEAKLALGAASGANAAARLLALVCGADASGAAIVLEFAAKLAGPGDL
jgi:hypothetical protein